MSRRPDSMIARLGFSPYRRLISMVRPYAGRLAAGVAFGGLFALMNGVLVGFVRGGFKVFDPQGVAWPALIGIVALLPVVALVRGAADFLASYCIQWVGNRVVMDLRNAMFEHLQRMSVAYVSENRSGELISRVTNDTALVERSVSVVISDLAKQPLTLVSMIAWVFWLDPTLAAVSLFVFPLCVVPISRYGRRVREASRQVQERMADVVSVLQESLAGARIVRAFCREDWETSRFAERTRAVFGRLMRVAAASAMVEPIIVMIAVAGVAVVLVYVRSVGMKVNDFAAFVAALFMMYEPVKKLGRIVMSLQQGSAAAERIFSLLDAPVTVSDMPGAVDLGENVDSISFENVDFSYESVSVLRGINLSVRGGERIAIVGSSGAGKTTLVNLVPRFFDVTSGRILINGRDIREYTLRSLRSAIGLVTQETFLFHDTVANNIMYGAPGATRAEVEEAARRAHAHEFISQMPHGYDTVVGERGVKLSGGERQRLAIARAILKNPRILIFDEATSALDSESERLVQSALDELMGGRTVFAIAHRLSTISNCDRIIVLDGGRIVEEGRHEELLALGGIYRRLYDLQFQDVPSPGNGGRGAP